MAETPFQSLSADDRRYALRSAEGLSGRPAHLLEKDLWIVQVLHALYAAPFGRELVFKGGTSLAKAYAAVRRFSEDVDITRDIRAMAPDLVAGAGADALPSTRSQERRWTRTIRERLAVWVREQVQPELERRLAGAGPKAAVSADGESLLVAYDPLFDHYGFVQPVVMVEFGARSTGEPHELRPVVCDAAASLPDLAFPTASPLVMLAERTFWEKATAMHVFCRQQRRRGQRLSRHWHDLVRLDDAGIAARALADRALARAVARHKAMFFAETDAAGNRIDYGAAVSGGLQLVPEGAAREELADDYARMLSAGMLLDDDESFAVIITRCSELQIRANRLAADGGSRPHCCHG